uniref:Protein kinase domain-containing protein n=1 Tax=Panagrolaimus sp. PS1159 TaxID=55785 RepID=A0AC35G6Y4_9BILA
MHGYIRYVSVSVHNGNEHRCRDDIWSWIYIMAEMLEGKLPWQNVKVDPTKIHALKMITPDSQLFATTKSKDPKGYLSSIAEYIRTVHADSKPDYVGIYRRLKNASNMSGTKFTDPYDWESGEQRGDCFLSESDLQRYFSHEEMLIVRKGDQRVELDPLFFRDDSPPQGVRKARRIRQNTESLEIPSFIDLDITQQSQSSGASGGGGASVRGSVKRTYRKDVSQMKKKMIIKENGGDGSGKKNNNTFSKIKKKRSSKESRDNITANNNNNNNDPRETMSFYSPKSPKSPLLSDEKREKDEKRRAAAAAAAVADSATTIVPKSAPQMGATNNNNNAGSGGGGVDSSKRKKRSSGKKEKIKEGSSKKKKNKKKKQFQHHQNNDITVDKTKEYTKDETSSKEDSSSEENKQPSPSVKKQNHSQVKPRQIKSNFAGKERKKQTTKGGSRESKSRESKSRESVPLRKKNTLRRKH